MPLKRSVCLSAHLAAALSLAGCATHQQSLADLPAREFVGHYTSGERASWFRPCEASAADSLWWVTFTDRSVAQLDSARAAGRFVPAERYFVRWLAALTDRGEVGPRGPGAPALLVRELLEMRPAAAGDCVAQ